MYTLQITKKNAHNFNYKTVHYFVSCAKTTWCHSFVAKKWLKKKQCKFKQALFYKENNFKVNQKVEF